MPLHRTSSLLPRRFVGRAAISIGLLPSPPKLERIFIISVTRPQDFRIERSGRRYGAFRLMKWRAMLNSG
jgi:hypothetical protein